VLLTAVIGRLQTRIFDMYWTLQCHQLACLRVCLFVLYRPNLLSSY